MNRATVPIVARLQALQTPSQLAPDGARVIAPATDSSPLAALMREINETVLARSLTFESSGGSSLTLDVAGRRVLRMTGSSGLPGADACLAADVLEDEHKDDLIKLMQAVGAPRSELRVMTGPTAREIDGVSVGLPVALLADLCLIELNPVSSEDAEPEPVMEQAPAVHDESPELPEYAPQDADAPEAEFLASLARETGPALMAWLIAGGPDDGQTYGPEEMVSHLQGFLEDEFDALTRQLDMVTMVPAGPVCLVLGASLVEGHSILCARSGDGILLGVIEGDGTQTLLRAWNSARG